MPNHAHNHLDQLQNQPRPPPQRRHRILMACDFFYPNCGGIENHIYQLSQCLIGLGHKVVVFTHAYGKGERTGVRWLTSGLKVYHAPRQPVHAEATPPTLFGGFALLREVLLRERITLVHAHQAFSAIAHEAILHARTMGYKVVFTDHSLVGFADPASIALNKMLKFTLADAHAVVCVSHTSRENTVLRACLPPRRVYVIPNAVDATQFLPAEVPPGGGGRITVVALSRLVYRKGVDLLNVVVPAVCRRHPHVDFIIGGGGPMAGMLRDTIQREGLADRVTMLGAVPTHAVRDVLVQGRIFLNASLTEAFCMAIVEAAAAGLLVVSTAVGGVPEVLPDDMMILAQPTPVALVQALDRALDQAPAVDRHTQHHRVAGFYHWRRVAERTVRVYDDVTASMHDDSTLARLRRAYKCGPWFGKICCCILAVDLLLLRLLAWLRPAVDIDSAPDYSASASALGQAGALPILNGKPGQQLQQRHLGQQQPGGTDGLPELEQGWQQWQNGEQQQNGVMKQHDLPKLQDPQQPCSKLRPRARRRHLGS